MASLTARLVRSSKVLAPPALLGWAIAVVVSAFSASGAPDAHALLLMAGCVGLAMWLGLAIALLFGSFMVTGEPVRASFGRDAWLTMATTLLVMAALAWPLREVIYPAIPRDYAFLDQLAWGLSLYSAAALGALCALATWIVRARKRGQASLFGAIRSYPLWTGALAFGIARAAAAPSVRVVAPGREGLLDAVLLVVLAIGMLGTADYLGRKLLLPLGAAWAVAVAALLGTVSSSDAARARLFEAYPGPAAFLEQIRGFYDLDGDGFSSVLGGNDCDDYEPMVSPFAIDFVGDAVDQNCNGVVAKPAVQPAAVRALSNVTSPLNVVLITVDTMRADFLSAEHAPRISALAKSSALFTRSYAAAPYTAGSIRAMMSGHPPMSTKIAADGSLGSEPMLAERLRDAGYDTTIVMYRWWGKGDGWAGHEGFEHKVTVEDDSAEEYFAVTGPKVTAAALPAIARATAQQKPFFLWIHYLDPHAEYVHRDGTPFSAQGDMLSRYAQEVWATDREVGRVLDALEAARFFDRGLLVVHSDHGELIEDGQRVGHAYWLTEGVLKTVLVLRGPDVPAGRYTTRVRLLDVSPTILDIAAGLQAPQFGASLRPVLRGEERADRDVVVYSSYEDTSQSAFLEGPNKLVQDYLRGTAALYDLSNDAAERENLIEARPEVAARLRSKLATVWDSEINDEVMERRARAIFKGMCDAGDARACAALQKASLLPPR